jgi:transcriptional regulator with XRE-family HTH domain
MKKFCQEVQFVRNSPPVPRKPARRHVVADIRIEVGLSQAGLAELLGVAAISIQRIEQGTLALSEELALKAEKTFDVSAAWLLANDPAQLAVTPRNTIWTKNFFELAQGTPPGHSYEVQHGVPAVDTRKMVETFTAKKRLEIFALVDAMLEGSAGLPKQGILISRLNSTLKELQKEFKADGKTLERYRPQIEKATKAFEKVRSRITEREKERLWSDNLRDLEPKK